MKTDSRRLKVLAVADYANPEWHSANLVGWKQYRALSAIADLHLVTNAINRENILKVGFERKDYAIDLSDVDRPLKAVARVFGADDTKNVGWTTLTAFKSFAYYGFEHRIWQLFEPRLRAREFDLVHRITPLSPVLPSVLAARCARIDVPFVIGPINGGTPWPKGFFNVRLREREFLSFVRGAYRLLPGYRSTRKHSHAIMVATRETRRQIAPQWRDKTVFIPEIGVDPEQFDRYVEGPASLPLRVAFVGRLAPIKCVDILIEAAAPFVRDKKVILDIIGDGPLMAELKAQAERERLGDGAIFAGWLGHDVQGSPHSGQDPGLPQRTRGGRRCRGGGDGDGPRPHRGGQRRAAGGGLPADGVRGVGGHAIGAGGGLPIRAGQAGRGSAPARGDEPRRAPARPPLLHVEGEGGAVVRGLSMALGARDRPDFGCRLDPPDAGGLASDEVTAPRERISARPAILLAIHRVFADPKRAGKARRDPSRLKLRGCARVGEGTRVRGRVWIRGKGEIIVGERVVLDGRFVPIELNAHLESSRIVIGDDVVIEGGTSIEADESVEIGKRCHIGRFVKIMDNQFHPLRGNRHRRPKSSAIRIEDDVVIESRAILLPATHIQHGARIGLRSVIGRRIGPGVFVAGIPVVRVRARSEGVS